MILSEQQRRWSEIKYYYFCMDIYNINKDMMEVVLLIEAMAHIGHLDYKTLKNIAAKMLGDPYYLPIKDEVISLAHLFGLKVATIERDFGFTRNTINSILKNRNTSHSPTPLLTVNEDQELYNFCQLISKLQKAGIHEKEKEN